MLDSEHNRNDWCPIEERLPEDNVTVFVRTDRDEVGIGYVETDPKTKKRLWVFTMKNEFLQGSRLKEWKDVRY